MKYTLHVYGWEGEFVCKSISPEDTKIIDDLKDSIEGAYSENVMVQHLEFGPDAVNLLVYGVVHGTLAGLTSADGRLSSLQ